MADEKRFVLVIENKDGENGGSGKANASTGSPEEQDTGDNTKAYFLSLAVQVGSQIATEAVSWAEYFWDENLRLTDDYIGQRQKRIAIQMVNRTVSAGSNIFSTTVQGATTGGAVGAIVGFVVSSGMEIYKTVSSNIKGNREEKILVDQLNAQMEFTRQRAGWSTRAASIGEDL